MLEDEPPDRDAFVCQGCEEKGFRVQRGGEGRIGGEKVGENEGPGELSREDEEVERRR